MVVGLKLVLKQMQETFFADDVLFALELVEEGLTGTRRTTAHGRLLIICAFWGHIS